MRKLLTSHVVHRLDGHRDDVEAVVANGSQRQRRCHALGGRRAHVHADVAHFDRIAAMGLGLADALAPVH